MVKFYDVIRTREPDGVFFPYDGTYPLEDNERAYYSADKVDELLEQQRDACANAVSHKNEATLSLYEYKVILNAIRNARIGK